MTKNEQWLDIASIMTLDENEMSTLFRNLTALGEYTPQTVRTTITTLQEERVKAALTGDATFTQYVTGSKPTVTSMDDIHNILFTQVVKSKLPQWKKLIQDNPILKQYEPIVALLETYYELKDYPHVKKGGHLDPIDGMGRRWIFHSPCHDHDATTFVHTAIGINCNRIINLSGQTLTIPAKATKQPQVTQCDFKLADVNALKGHVNEVKEGETVVLCCKDGVNDTAAYFLLFNVLGWVQKKTPDTVIVSAYGDYLTHLVKNAPLPITKPDELRLPTLDTLKEMCRPLFLAQLKD
ncbi:MAG: hypothetical protein KDK65_05330 [Chlamydiia bacterium]|nr:hypothetical protein [Chlamydiia bacterium]